MDNDIHTGIAGEDLSAAASLIVYQDDSDDSKIKIAVSATSIELCGVLYEGAADDKKVKFVKTGYTTGKAGATGLLPGMALTTDGQGRFILGVSTNKIVGTFCPALEGNSDSTGIAVYQAPAVGDEIRVLLDPTKMTILP